MITSLHGPCLAWWLLEEMTMTLLIIMDCEIDDVIYLCKKHIVADHREENINQGYSKLHQRMLQWMEGKEEEEDTNPESDQRRDFIHSVVTDDRSNPIRLSRDKSPFHKHVIHSAV